MNDSDVRARARELAEGAGVTVHNVYKLGRSWRISGTIPPDRPFFVGWIVGRQAFLDDLAATVGRRAAREDAQGGTQGDTVNDYEATYTFVRVEDIIDWSPARDGAATPPPYVALRVFPPPHGADGGALAVPITHPHPLPTARAKLIVCAREYDALRARSLAGGWPDPLPVVAYRLVRVDR